MFHRILLFLALFSLAAGSILWSADARASAVLAKAQQAAGGADKLAALEDFIAERKIESVGGGLSGRQVYKVVLPAAMRQESSLPFGNLIVTVVDGQGKMQSFQGSGPLPPAQLAQAQGELFRLRESLLLADRDPDRTVSFVGEETVGERKAEVVEVVAAKEDGNVKLYIDADSGELFQIAYPGFAFQGEPRTIVERYSDFRDVDGVQAPFLIEAFDADKPITIITVEKLLYNTGLTKAEL